MPSGYISGVNIMTNTVELKIKKCKDCNVGILDECDYCTNCKHMRLVRGEKVKGKCIHDLRPEPLKHGPLDRWTKKLKIRKGD